MNEFKHELFEKAGIGIPNEDIESNDVCIFGWDIQKLWNVKIVGQSWSWLRRKLFENIV